MTWLGFIALIGLILSIIGLIVGMVDQMKDDDHDSF